MNSSSKPLLVPTVIGLESCQASQLVSLCRCGYEFCYNCGAEWKNKKATCQCPLWEEDNIWHEEDRDSDDDEEDEEDGDSYYTDDEDYEDDDYGQRLFF